MTNILFMIRPDRHIDPDKAPLRATPLVAPRDGQARNADLTQAQGVVAADMPSSQGLPAKAPVKAAKARPGVDADTRKMRNIAEHYVASRECSADMLRTVLARRILRWKKGVETAETDRARLSDLAEAEITRLVRAGFIDDLRYAEMRARALLASGAGLRKIAFDLSRKGIDRDTADQAVRAASEDITGHFAAPQDVGLGDEIVKQAEEVSIEVFMRKKRIGPFRANPLPEDFSAARKILSREMAALARRGFDLDAIRRAMGKTAFDEAAE